MGGRLRKNTFAEGAVIAYIAILLVKILGAVYSIPFYSIIGDKGGFIYSCAYNVYAFFYDIATSGIPVAISIIIGEYNSLNQYASKEKAYRIGKRIVLCFSFVAFLALQLFARSIAMGFIGEMEYGARPEEVTSAIRAVSICLLLVPFLSMRRGYLEGHKVIGTSSTSQVVEQLVRIAVVLLGSFITIRLLRQKLSTGINIALLGTAVGAGAALLYIEIRCRKDKNAFEKPRQGERSDDTGKIVKKILSYCATLVIVAVAISIYNLVDMKLILDGLHSLHFADEETQTIASVASSWVPKICNIITALAIGMTHSIAPHAAGDYARGDMKGVNNKINQSMEIILIIALPLAVGISILSTIVYSIFYGPNEAGSYILKLCTFLNVVGSMVTVIGMTMQSINKGKMLCISMVCGIVLNASLDLPLIYLFHRLGLRPYLGATVSSIIGQVVTFIIMTVYLHKTEGFTYRSALVTFLRLLPALIAMGAVVMVLRHFWPPMPGRLLQLLQFAACALCGVLVYFPVAYKTRALDGLLKEDFVQRILARLHLKLKENK